jgi:SAM-dependent methyltransferase
VPFDTTTGLVCQSCAREFPLVDGVWVLWSDAVKRLYCDRQHEPPRANTSDRVKHANIAIYEQISEAYSEHHDGIRPYTETILFLRALGDDFQSRPEPGRDRVLVDVGCATGVGLELGSRGYRHVVGVDLSLANLRVVRDKGFLPVLADADRLPFQAGAIDLITCFATLHHLPEPASFVKSAFECVRAGGVLLTGCEPSRASMAHRGLGRLVWDGRKPVYRALARLTGSSRYHLHGDERTQAITDLAEHNRTHGGFAPEALDDLFRAAGFHDTQVFYDVDKSGFRSIGVPGWKMLVLKALSLQNPIARSNWCNLTAMGRKGFCGTRTRAA